MACTEYKVVTSGQEMHYFLNSDKYLVRLSSKDMTMDYKNFKAGAPDAALFEVPAGYSKPGEASASNSSSSNSDSGAAAPAEQPKKKKGLGGLMKR